MGNLERWGIMAQGQRWNRNCSAGEPNLRETRRSLVFQADAGMVAKIRFIVGDQNQMAAHRMGGNQPVQGIPSTIPHRRPENP